MSYEPLHHKYRPQTFANLVGQEAIATTLTNAILTERIAPAYLFTGPRGTGKTSSARILAKSLNCQKHDKPTESPCGVCEVCLSIASGYSLDVIEIDAASNTGVDNIREIIERAQFAPVQCRYKVYVIDECLTGDSLVQTSEGLIRIDNPSLKGKKVLSYNDSLGVWEFKKVVRWLEQGERQTLVIKTTNREIRCTGNHLIRTEAGWIEAKDLKKGTKILSPVNAAAAPSLTNLGRMDAPVDLLEVTSSKGIHTGKKHTTCPLSLNKLNLFDPYAPVGVENDLISPPFYRKKVEELRAFSHAGKSIHTKKDTESGISVQKSSSLTLNFCNPTHWVLSTELCLGIVPSPTQTNSVDSLGCVGHMERNSRNGWSTKPVAFQNYNQSLKSHLTRDTGIYQFAVTHLVIPNSRMSLTLLSHMGEKNSSLWTGSIGLPQKDLPGGIWMMGHSVSVRKEAHRFDCIQKDTLPKKIKPLPVGLQPSIIQQQQNFTHGVAQVRHTTTYAWAQTPVESGWQTSNSIQPPQWITNLEIVESVKVAGIERVYDIEVASNHNFVANGILVHNCHMLSTAAFNALLKTLEEPPARVVFVLATTDPQRVLPTIISRCQKFDFRRIALEAMVKHLLHIASQENINITSEAITLVAQVAQGGLRDAESLLDQLSLLPGEVTLEAVWDLVGAVPEQDLMALTKAIADDNSEVVLDQCRRLMDRGREPLVVLQSLAGFYRDLLIARTAPNRSNLVAITPPTWKQLCEFAQQMEVSSILLGSQHLKNSEAQVKNTTQPRLWLEVTLLGLLPSANIPQPASTTSQSPLQQSEVKRQESPTRREPSPRPQELTPPVSSHSAGQAIPNDRQNETHPPPEPTAPTSAPNRNPVSDPQHQQPVAATAKESPASSSEPTPLQPTASTVSAAEQFSDSEPTIKQIWEQVLKHLHPFAAHALVSQHCHLLSFEGSLACVGISSQPLLTLAQEKLPNLEAAFEAVYNYPVQVRLQAQPSKSSNPPRASRVSASAAASQRLEVASPPSYSGNDRTPNVANSPTDNSRTEAAQTSEHRRVSAQPSDTATNEPKFQSRVIDQTSQATVTRLAPQSSLTFAQRQVSPELQPKAQVEIERGSLTTPINQSPLSLSVQEVDSDGDEVEQALRVLKQFFEGEFVELTDEFSDQDATIALAPPHDRVSVAAQSPAAIASTQPELEPEEYWEEPDSIEKAATHQMQSSEIAAWENTQKPLRQDNLQYDENGEIAF